MTYYELNKERCLAYAKQYYIDHTEEKAKYQDIHRDHRNALQRKRDKKKRRKVLDIVFTARFKVLKVISNDNLSCAQCGCNDIRLLEINHINGGGSKETDKGRKNSYFWNNILSGKRKTDDLEILCRVCNARHYLESKYGKLPYKITFSNE